jgi:hypothetical protein
LIPKFASDNAARVCELRNRDTSLGDPDTALTTAAAWIAVLALEDQGGKTLLHKDEASRKLHEQMGFHEGWNTPSTSW